MTSKTAIAVGLLLVAALVACSSEPEIQHQRFRLRFVAADDRDRPLAGVSIALAGEGLGVTAADGSLGRELRAADGHVAELAASCPDGYLNAEAPETLTFRALRSLEGPEAPAELSVTIRCPRAERRAAIVVRADGRAGLPVLVDGVVRAITDRDGVAHLALSVPPHTPLQVKLDTSESARLQPQNPHAVFTVGDLDDVFVFDQPFELRRETKRRRRAPASAPEPDKPARPVRLN